MGVINLKISDETETLFRIELLKRFTKKKGIMGEQVDIALKNWLFRKDVWVQDLEEEKAPRYIRNSEANNPKLEYFTGLSMREKRLGLVGMYYRLKSEGSY
ncbi:MAG: hypothetical protein ACXABF_17345 [Candidatus Thorarchaeota archaeon]|jgi:hypothetical protein